MENKFILNFTPTGMIPTKEMTPYVPVMPDEIKRRQQAAMELAPHLESRQTLILEGRLLAEQGRAMERF